MHHRQDPPRRALGQLQRRLQRYPQLPRGARCLPQHPSLLSSCSQAQRHLALGTTERGAAKLLPHPAEETSRCHLRRPGRAAQVATARQCNSHHLERTNRQLLRHGTHGHLVELYESGAAASKFMITCAADSVSLYDTSVPVTSVCDICTRPPRWKQSLCPPKTLRAPTPSARCKYDLG